MDNPGETRFDTFKDHLVALDSLLNATKRELCLFDTDLKTPNLESPQRAQLLADLLLASPGHRLRIVLHDTDHVERHCPRLMLLLKRFTHNFEIRRTPDDLRHLTKCFAVGDQSHGVVRFHAGHGRGKLLLDVPAEVEGWRRQFDELWECSQHGLSPTRLGL